MMIAMTQPVVKVQVHGSVGTITLNRPDKRNALTREMIAAVDQALDDLHHQRSARCVILTGAGSAFCAGMDLAEMLETSKQDDALDQWGRDAVVYRDLLETMLRFPKPIIAAVNGPAVAGGAGLVLGCDLTVAATSARFGLPEPLRGLTAGIVSPLLAFRAGGSTAARLLLGCEIIDAAEAVRLGLFHEMVANDKVWARASEIAGRCALAAPEALQLTKRMLYETIGEHLSSQFASGAAASATARTTEAAAEGLAAFLEKRDPNWP
jgi:enoyl-CoA hydratase/carnithine racemase